MSCPPTTIFSVPGDETCQFLHGISCIHYSLLLKLENVCSLPCLQMMAPLRPLRTITQMSLLNLLLNLLRKCHYSNHYSSLLKGHFHYSSLLTHYAMGTLLMLELCHLTKYLVYNSLQFQPSDSRHCSPPRLGLNL